MTLTTQDIDAIADAVLEKFLSYSGDTIARIDLKALADMKPEQRMKEMGRIAKFVMKGEKK